MHYVAATSDTLSLCKLEDGSPIWSVQTQVEELFPTPLGVLTRSVAGVYQLWHYPKGELVNSFQVCRRSQF